MKSALEIYLDGNTATFWHLISFKQLNFNKILPASLWVEWNISNYIFTLSISYDMLSNYTNQDLWRSFNEKPTHTIMSSIMIFTSP